MQGNQSIGDHCKQAKNRRNVTEQQCCKMTF